MLALLLLSRLSARYGSNYEDGHFIQPTALDAFILLYLSFTGLAFYVSPLPDVSLPKFLVVILGVFGYYLVQEWVTTTERLRWLTVVFTLSAIAITLIGLFTVEWPARQVLNLESLTTHLPHLSGDFYTHPNEVAAALIILFPFCLALWRWPAATNAYPLSWQRPLALVSIVITTLGLLVTQSRGAVLALFLGGLMALSWSRPRWRLPLLGLVFLGSILFLFLLVSGIGLEGSADSLAVLDTSSKSGASTNNSWLIRLDIWRTARSLIRDYPVVGAGLDTFGDISRANYMYQRLSPEQNPYHAHNLFLQTITSLGWPGFLALLGLWVTAAYGLERASHSPDPQIYCLTVVYSASLAAYLLFNLFDVLSLGQKPGIFTWFVLAGCAAIGRLRQVKLPLARPLPVVPLLAFCLFSLTSTLPRNLANLQLDQARWRGDKAESSLVDRLAGDARRRGLAAYLLGDTAAALAYWRDDPDALSFLQIQGRLVATTKNPGEAIPWYNLALALDGSAASAYFWRGIAYEKMGVAGLALADYQTAARLAPEEMDNAWQGRILFHWAILSFQLGDLPTAVATLERAIELDPAAPWYYQTLGDMLMASGDENGAAVAYEKAKG